MRNLFIIICIILAVIISALLAYKITHVAPSGMESVSSLLHKSEAESAEGDYTSAIKYLSEIIAKYPDSPQAELAFFELSSAYEKKGDLLKAKESYQKIIEKFPASNNISKAQEGLEGVNIKILFSPLITPGSFYYEVQKGDTLSKIAKRFNTTMELISRVNNIKGGMIRIGKQLKISKARFAIVVDKSQSILTLKSDGDILKTYKVSTGVNNSTPAGKFKITAKITNPTWYTTGAVIPPGSPNNILGSRWMGISVQGYGIHGTTEPRSIGKNVTAGCVRMRNSDAEELYTIVPEGTEVIIID